jgi:hypothetical protein
MKSFQAESRLRASKLDEILNALDLSPTEQRHSTAPVRFAAMRFA